jgi:hypothetical protein
MGTLSEEMVRKFNLKNNEKARENQAGRGVAERPP